MLTVDGAARPDEKRVAVDTLSVKQALDTDKMLRLAWVASFWQMADPLTKAIREHPPLEMVLALGGLSLDCQLLEAKLAEFLTACQIK